MSDKRPRGSSDDHDGKEKLIKYSNEKQQETGDKSQSLPPPVPTYMGLTAEDMSIFNMMADLDGEDNLEEFIRQQQRGYHTLQQTQHPLLTLETGKSTQRETRPDPKGKGKLEDSQSDRDSDDEYFPTKHHIIISAPPLRLGNRSTARSEMNHWPSPAYFEVRIPRSNKLVIPYEDATEHFQPSSAPQPPNHLQQYTLHLTDYLKSTSWEMKFICYVDEEAYVVNQGWEQYMDQNGVSHGDTILLVKKHSNSNSNSFLIFHKMRSRPSPVNIPPPEFLEENLLYEINLTDMDIAFGILEMTEAATPFQCKTQEMVKLTDEKRTNWYLIIKRVICMYVMFDGWERFVREHELAAGDMVSFYKPVHADHGKHFLVKCEKKKRKEEGGSNPRKSSDGAGPSQGGSRES